MDKRVEKMKEKIVKKIDKDNLKLEVLKKIANAKSK